MSISSRKPPKSDKPARVSRKLDEIEAELRRIGFWTEDPPQFSVNNYLEAPTFELWLQCIFLPNARKAAEEDRFPSTSQVGLMAMRQYDYHEHVEAAQPLLALLREFDRIINT